MRRLSIALIAGLGLAACDPALGPLDPNAPRIALAGSDLEERLSGKTLVMTPTENEGGLTATVVMRPNGTATVSAGTFSREMLWSIQGQTLCFTRPGETRDADDCRTIGWIQGDRFAVFDAALGNEKIADGVIRNS